MKQGRTPDRVHVVHQPEDRAEIRGGLPVAPPNSRAMEIIRTLAQISDKLKRSEAERYQLLAELREYRKSLNELEDKADKTEKAYLSLENKLKGRDAIESEISQRQARFERALKETESKLVQAAAGQNLLDTRIKSTEEFQAGIAQRFEDTLTEQARLDRQMEKISQDKARMLRKVERMEEILTETQDTLKARALVLLTDQSAAAQSGFPQIGTYAEGGSDGLRDVPWWRRSVRMQGVGMASMIVAALLFGWTVNQVQQPDIPKIAVLQNGGMAKLNLKDNRWEPITETQDSYAPSSSESETAGQADETLTPVGIAGADTTDEPVEQTPAAKAALESSDDQLMAALEDDPEKLAASLNEIAPETATDFAIEEAPKKIVPPGVYNPLKPLSKQAFAQDPALASDIAKEKGRDSLTSRVSRDESLPASIQKLEAQAFGNVPEAQHDLAAIYTAGRGGVAQNFERAALWFREAADNKVANAGYNLGVLYHQGLGVEKDINRALYWYKEAAKLGHPEAQYNLGISYIEGIGTEYNAPLAAAFFESAANQGVVEAAYNLGLIYENGLIDDGAKSEDALLWYKIAADGGSTDARAALQQLASALKINQGDIDKMVERMQATYQSAKGRRAGPQGKA